MKLATSCSNHSFEIADKAEGKSVLPSKNRQNALSARNQTHVQTGYAPPLFRPRGNAATQRQPSE